MGIDPTYKSLHIGNLLPIITLIRFKMYGHIPLIVIGGATGMVGDPSGKYQTRSIIDIDLLIYNTKSIQNQLLYLLAINNIHIAVFNNYNWLKNKLFISFMKDIGTCINISNMMSKDIVKKRLIENGITFIEFTYPLIQGYDFLHLYWNNNCTMQIGGSDQWGNITTGIYLIRKKIGRSAYGLTCNLLTKSDGTKYGKSELGENIWLESKLTYPYKFYQFWFNLSDIDAEKYIKMYTFLNKEEIDNIIKIHNKESHNRILQKKLASEITQWIHGKEYLKQAVEASKILFSNHTINIIKYLDAKYFLEIFNGVPNFKISIYFFKNGVSIIDLLVKHIKLFTSNKSAIRSIKSNSILLNKHTVNVRFIVTDKCLLLGRYILLQKGKKQFFIIEVF